MMHSIATSDLKSDDRYVVPNQTQEQETDYLCWCSKQKNGKISKTLIGKVTKVIHGTLLGARLFHDKLKVRDPNQYRIQNE